MGTIDGKTMPRKGRDLEIDDRLLAHIAFKSAKNTFVIIGPAYIFSIPRIYLPTCLCLILYCVSASQMRSVKINENAFISYFFLLSKKKNK